MTDDHCPIEREEFGCTLPAGHDGVHRAHVSHDLARAYTVIDLMNGEHK